MYGLCSTRFNLCFFPYASRKIICNSWVGTAQEIRSDLMILGNVNSNNTYLPCTKNEVLSITDGKTKNNTDNIFEWSLNKRKDNRDIGSDDTIDCLSYQLHNSLVSLPVIYMSHNHLQINRSSTYLSVNCDDLNTLGFHQLLFKITDNSVDKDEVVEKLTKQVIWRKRNVNTKLDGPKGKLENRHMYCVNISDEGYLPRNYQFYSQKSKDECEVEEEDESKEEKKGSKKQQKVKKSPLSGLKKLSKGKEKSGAKAVDVGTTWASIEKMLPVWQNQIADILQKLQDLVFKPRPSIGKKQKKSKKAEDDDECE